MCVFCLFLSDAADACGGPQYRRRFGFQLYAAPDKTQLDGFMPSTAGRGIDPADRGEIMILYVAQAPSMA